MSIKSDILYMKTQTKKATARKHRRNEMLNLGEFAFKMNVSLKAVRAAIAAGHIKKGLHIQSNNQKKIDYRVALEEWKQNVDAKFIENQGSLDSETSPLNKAKLRKANAEAEIKEMDAKKRSGELVEIKDIQKIFDKIAHRVQQNLLNLPGKVAPELASETDPHALELVLDREIRDCLTDLSYEFEHQSGDEPVNENSSEESEAAATSDSE